MLEICGKFLDLVEQVFMRFRMVLNCEVAARAHTFNERKRPHIYNALIDIAVVADNHSNVIPRLTITLQNVFEVERVSVRRPVCLVGKGGEADSHLPMLILVVQWLAQTGQQNASICCSTPRRRKRARQAAYSTLW